MGAAPSGFSTGIGFGEPSGQFAVPSFGFGGGVPSVAGTVTGIVGQIAGLQVLSSGLPVPGVVRLPGHPRPRPRPVSVPPVSPSPVEPTPMPAPIVTTLGKVGGQVGEVTGALLGEQVGGLGAPVGAVIGRELGTQLGKAAGQLATDIFRPVNELLTGFRATPVPARSPFGSQIGNPAGPMLPFPQPEPGEPPAGGQPLIVSQQCPECAGQQDKLLQQRAQVGRQIATEQAQQRASTIQQQQTQLERLETLEKQSTSTRNVEQELQQKQALLRQIETELAQLQQQQEQAVETASTSAITSQRAIVSGAEMPPSAAAAGAGPMPAPISLPPVPGFYQLCLACQSLEDVSRFLNGEQSACSVMTTRFIAGGSLNG